MGLDMYLTGDAYRCGGNHDTKPDEEPVIESNVYSLAYWRKHPNLHRFIVNEFADGVDECQEIELSSDDLDTIIDAIRNRKVPDTEGFFFGESDDSDEQMKEDIAYFERAKRWLKDKSKDAEGHNLWKSVIYRASW